MTGIYKITSITNKIYVGQSIDIERRKNAYRLLCCKDQPALYNSLLKHGFENHTFEVIEECSIELLNERERHYQELYNSVNNGLNCKLLGGGNSRAVIVLNTENGIYYECIKDASFANNIPATTLRNKLSGYRKNNTSFIYA